MAWHVEALPWLIHAAVGGTLFLMAGCLAVLCCKQPVRRIRLIELTLAGTLVLPLASRASWLPHWSAGWLDLEPRSAAPAPPLDEANAAAPDSPLPDPLHSVLPTERLEADTAVPLIASSAEIAAPEAPAVVQPVATPSAPPVSLLLVTVYGGGAALLLLWSLLGICQLVRLKLAAHPAPPDVVALFHEIAGPAGERVQLLVSERIEVPLAFAGWRPVIVLPVVENPATLRYSLAHEWSHVERGDVWRWHLTTLAGLVVFWQPLFWWLRRQLRLDQDYLADARAAEQAPEAEDYADYLVGLARRRLAVPAAALSIGGRRSHLYRRIVMLLQARPLERRCLTLWSAAAVVITLAVLATVAAVRLDAGTPPETEKETPKQETKDKPKEIPGIPGHEHKAETLKYSGVVVDKTTKKPIQGVAVTVRRSLYGDPTVKSEDLVLEETKHTTDAAGRYDFTIPPEQSGKRYLYIELDVEHPEYASQKGFGYSLGMIRKNEKHGGEPFFSKVEMRHGKPITGKVQTADGKPTAGVKVMAYSTTEDPNVFEYGSFADTTTDKDGNFRLVLITPGRAAFWILPEEYIPSTHLVRDNKRGDVGTFTLLEGPRLRGTVLDAKGKPLAGVAVNARAEERNDELNDLRVSDNMERAAVTNDKGEFELKPLPPGKYLIRPDEHLREPSKRDRKTYPMLAVFVNQRVALKAGANPEPIEVRAVPHVTIEAQFLDTKGKPTRGHAPFVFGQVDKITWFSKATMDANGKVTIHVPHGMEGTTLELTTNEHGVLRWRKSKDDKLTNERRVRLGTVNDDVKGIEIVRYTAPILMVKVTAKDGAKLTKPGVTAAYEKGQGPRDGQFILEDGLNSDVMFERQGDGRFRSSQLLPEQEVTVTAQAEGYQSKSEKLKLPEGETKEIEIVLEKK